MDNSNRIDLEREPGNPLLNLILKMKLESIITRREGMSAANCGEVLAGKKPPYGELYFDLLRLDIQKLIYQAEGKSVEEIEKQIKSEKETMETIRDLSKDLRIKPGGY